jgi:ATP-dependent helicase HrpB
MQAGVRPDLRLIVMSATLEAEPVAAYLGNCPILVSEGRSFPVEVRHLDYYGDERPVVQLAAEVVGRILDSGEGGDVLVFMPGQAEIHATLDALRGLRAAEKLALIPLHGELPPADQDLAFAPHRLRKIVVATNVAETSVTIDGIRHVVDSGLARVARYDPERGIGTLFLEEISRASAEQRRGRAGRTAPGTCHRLWTESGHLNRPERNTPEIRRADLADVVLLLHSLGIRQAAAFDWLDRPEPQAVERAERLLHLLGALDPVTEQLTPLGRRMRRLPMHPRYARMLIEASDRGCVPEAALCAALVSGRDLLLRPRRDDPAAGNPHGLFEADADSDFHTLMRAWQFAHDCGYDVGRCQHRGIHAQTARQVGQTWEQFLAIARQQGLMDSGQARSAGPPTPREGNDALLRCLLAGFVDQLCLRRSPGGAECDLTEGRQGTLVRESVVREAPLFVAGNVREVAGRGAGSRTLVSLASAVKREWLAEMFPASLASVVEHLYDSVHKRVAAVRRVRFGDLILGQDHVKEVDPALAGRALAEAQRKGLFELPQFNHDLRQLVARVNLVSVAMPDLELPPFDEAAILQSLARAFRGLTLAKDAQEARLRDAFLRHLAPEQLSWIDEMAPLTVAWPDGRRLKLTYAEEARDANGRPNPPELSVKLHECFPLREHPVLCEGRVAVRLWLCAPDGKRLEPTVNWPTFRTAQYPKLKAGLQRKYPGFTWL